VQQDWYVPVIRNYYEYMWYLEVDKIVPEITPKILYANEKPYFFVMEYYDPKKYPLWKNELFNLKLDNKFAKNFAIKLANIHNITFNNKTIANNFNTSELFEDLRINPYIRSTAILHNDVSEELLSIADNLYNTNLALVHGDISPKNILINNSQPIFLDAECAWYGDPAFDISFCLNHIILKSLVLESIQKELISYFNIISHNYLRNIMSNDLEKYEKRIIALLSALMLSRIDGKSPVEYITSDKKKEKVRSFSKFILKNPINSLLEFSQKWLNGL
jgi:5-methylthioribose kinase